MVIAVDSAPRAVTVSPGEHLSAHPLSRSVGRADVHMLATGIDLTYGRWAAYSLRVGKVFLLM